MKLQTVVLLLCCCCSDAKGAGPEAGHRDVAASRDQANRFLDRLRRPRRNIWDRSRPDVQQWIQQLRNMGYDEARLEADLSYWMDQRRSSDQGRQHQYDENAAVGPRDASSYRHGADVNYDYY
ncbi:augurin-A-like [Pempheris klunzingeri]|uniref:augurin-A-like n=1 Tax=Pempheris klunzingeri TaxID=3127111 RepID=UPI00397F0AEE